MRAISAILDAVASLVERLLPGRATRFLVSIVLTIAVGLIIYVVSSAKLARWL